jgi:chromate reductase
MNSNYHFIGISGSLRKGSLNTALLNASLELLPEGVTMEITSIADIPIYNGDNDLPLTTHRPESVTTFRNKLANADGLVIVSPEYNYSIPGGLKNAIDWASRGEDSPLLNKPVALMGATPGMWGTVRMHLAFQAVFVFLDMKAVYKPEVFVAQASKKFDADGKLTDEFTINLLKKKLQALKDIIIQLNKN